MRALFIGGGKSGKSTAAQRLAASLAGGGPGWSCKRKYIAHFVNNFNYSLMQY